jgi:hypothetical protein
LSLFIIFSNEGTNFTKLVRPCHHCFFWALDQVDLYLASQQMVFNLCLAPNVVLLFSFLFRCSKGCSFLLCSSLRFTRFSVLRFNIRSRLTFIEWSFCCTHIVCSRACCCFRRGGRGCQCCTELRTIAWTPYVFHIKLRRQFDFEKEILSCGMLIPQVRPAHKYPISPWEMIHPPGGDNAVCM